MERRCSKSTIWTLVAFCAGAIVVVGGSATAKNTIIGLHEPGTGGYQTTGNTAGDDEGSGWTAGTSGGSSGGGSSGGSSGGGSSGGGSSGGGTSGGGTGGSTGGGGGVEEIRDENTGVEARGWLPKWFTGSRNETRIVVEARPDNPIAYYELYLGGYLVHGEFNVDNPIRLRFRFDSTKFRDRTRLPVRLVMYTRNGERIEPVFRRVVYNRGIVYVNNDFARLPGGNSYGEVDGPLTALNHTVSGSTDASWRSDTIMRETEVSTAWYVTTHGMSPDTVHTGIPYFVTNEDDDLVHARTVVPSIAEARIRAIRDGLPPISAAFLDACLVMGSRRRPDLTFGKAFLIDMPSGGVKDSICRFALGWRHSPYNFGTEAMAGTFWKSLQEGYVAEEARNKAVRRYYQRVFYDRPIREGSEVTALVGDFLGRLGGVYDGTREKHTRLFLLLEPRR
jgi:hypothetical protein